MHKKPSFIVLVLLYMVPHLFAGITGKVSGKIIDSDTQEPLIGANVTIVGTEMSVQDLSMSLPKRALRIILAAHSISG